MYVTINQEKIHISYKTSLDVIERKNIDCIINANHRQMLKIHNVTHLFTRDGKHYYFTRELNHYEKFKNTLKENFNEYYTEIDKTVSGYPDDVKTTLLQNI